MPLPWKKAKNGRISRIISDLRSLNRGKSLVVQTGFPASIVDLIMKNGERLKKPMKKNRFEIPNPTSPCLSSSNSMFSASEIKSSTCLVVNEVEDVIEFSVASLVLISIEVLFLLIMLVLGAKKLAIWITVSAFSLLFLEYTANRVFCLFNFKPCRDTQKRLHSKTDGIGHNEILDFDLSGDVCDQIDKIRIIESDFDLLSREKRWGVTDFDMNKRTCSGKIKAKLLKKFVPKKLRRSKRGGNCGKYCQDSISEVFNCIGEEKLEKGEGLEQQKDDHDEQDPEEEEDRDDVPNTINVSQVEWETDLAGENMRRRITEGSSRNPVLIVIVLAGLVGGRIMALVLTILWCLLVKSVRVVSFRTGLLFKRQI